MDCAPSDLSTPPARPAPAGAGRMAPWAAAALLALATSGCVTTEGVRYGEVTAVPGAYAAVPAPLSIGEIVAELRAGRVQADLAADIRQRGLLAPARGADIDLLLQQGAGSELISAVRDESEEMLRAAPVAPAPVTVVPGYYGYYPYYDPYYGWYPWVPFSFGLWWYGGDHHHRPAPGVRPYRPAPAARPPSPRAPVPFKPSR